MKLRLKLCAICYEDGNNEAAVGSYVAQDGQYYEVCKKHLDIAEEVGCLILKWKDGEEIEES